MIVRRAFALGLAAGAGALAVSGPVPASEPGADGPDIEPRRAVTLRLLNGSRLRLRALALRFRLARWRALRIRGQQPYVELSGAAAEVRDRLEQSLGIARQRPQRHRYDAAGNLHFVQDDLLGGDWSPEAPEPRSFQLLHRAVLWTLEGRMEPVDPPVPQFPLPGRPRPDGRMYLSGTNLLIVVPPADLPGFDE